MGKRQDDDIDLERAAMDPDYRRKVLRRLKAEAEGNPAAPDDGGDALAAAPMSRHRGPVVKPPRK